MAKLSICVPSRNRQIWFQETIRALLESPRDDVEFVFADNSDDASVMADFMLAHAGDPRVTFLSPGPVVYSMVDNWERTVAASTGDWVTVIGDDDYVDPDLASVLKKVELLLPDVEAFGWAYASFTWPGSDGGPETNIALDLAHHFVDMPKEWLIRRAYLWAEATTTPTHGFSIYHSALSRRLVERIRTRFNGRYFEHPTVDFDSSFKSVLLGNRFVLWQRPLSIHGVCPLSISSIVYDAKAIPAANATFMSELGRNFFDDPTMEGLPFMVDMGVPASILATQQWVKHSAGFAIDGWQENFARACAYYCSRFPPARISISSPTAIVRPSRSGMADAMRMHSSRCISRCPPATRLFPGSRTARSTSTTAIRVRERRRRSIRCSLRLPPPIDDIVIDPATLRRPADAAAPQPVPVPA